MTFVAKEARYCVSYEKLEIWYKEWDAYIIG